MYSSFGTCNANLFAINLTNDFAVDVSTGNIQFLTNSDTVNAPMSEALQNTSAGSANYQKETICLPTSATKLFMYPSPSYTQKTLVLASASVRNYNISQATISLTHFLQGSHQ